MVKFAKSLIKKESNKGLHFRVKKMFNIKTAVILSLLAFAIAYPLQQLLTNPAQADPLTYPHPPLEESTISLTKPDDINITIDPTPTGDNISTAFNSTDVTTTNLTGYNLTLNTTSTDNKLTHTSLDTNYINPLAANNTELIASTWGYTTTNPTTPSTALFNTVPTNQSPTTLKTTTEPNSTTAGTTPDTTTVYYGAKVDFTKPAGNYTNTIVYTAVGNLVDSLTAANVSPDTGYDVGGDMITITGTNFDSIINITVGGNDCTNIQITSTTTATCTTPAGTVGVADIVITGQGGSVTLTDAFTYYAPEVTYCGTYDYECIIFTINTTDGTYSIPTSGYVSGRTSHTFDWDVYVDGVLTNDCLEGNCTGTGSYVLTSVSPGANGIALTGLSSGNHQIRIIPHHDDKPYSTSGSIPGWGNAFGHYSLTTGANVATNKNKLITLDAPFTTMAFAPKTTESTTSADSMFAYLFYGCINLTDTIEILDNYTLPSTMNTLSNFLGSVHYGNAKLTTPIDLTSLTNWLNENNSITNLGLFLANAHYDNSQLNNTINLTPIADWFKANTSITTLNGFLANTHRNNSILTSPIDLTPIAGWLNNNNSITILDSFLAGTHYDNSALAIPINLSPVANWFNANRSIINLTFFLSNTHNGNIVLEDPIDLNPISNWFYQNDSITNLSYFLNHTYYGDSTLTDQVNLTPLTNWFYRNNTITNLSYFLSSTHNGNSVVIDSVNLSPIASWFYHNEKITNLASFFSNTHYGNNNLANPIDLSPISSWFYRNNTITNLSNFHASTYYSNSNMVSTINLTPISNWFYHNEKITNLSSFLTQVHSGNVNLTNVIDLSPISSWFNENNSIAELSSFLMSVHSNNQKLTSTIDLSPITNWFYRNTSITNLRFFMSQVHSGNNAILTSPVDLTPVTNWFYQNNSIENFSYFLNNIHANNSKLTNPVDLLPVAGWFNNNTSIDNLSNFLSGSHSNNASLTSPINLTPLAGWFSANRSVTTLTSFMSLTHYFNSNLILTGQVILPTWIKTMTDGDGTPIWDIGTTTSSYSFYQTFYLNRINDTGEVEFMDNDVMSSMGEPSNNRRTFTGRTGIQPANLNWQ